MKGSDEDEGGEDEEVEGRRENHSREDSLQAIGGMGPGGCRLELCHFARGENHVHLEVGK